MVPQTVKVLLKSIRQGNRKNSEREKESVHLSV